MKKNLSQNIDEESEEEKGIRFGKGKSSSSTSSVTTLTQRSEGQKEDNYASKNSRQTTIASSYSSSSSYSNPSFNTYNYRRESQSDSSADDIQSLRTITKDDEENHHNLNHHRSDQEAEREQLIDQPPTLHNNPFVEMQSNNNNNWSSDEKRVHSPNHHNYSYSSSSDDRYNSQNPSLDYSNGFRANQEHQYQGYNHSSYYPEDDEDDDRTRIQIPSYSNPKSNDLTQTSSFNSNDLDQKVLEYPPSQQLHSKVPILPNDSNLERNSENQQQQPQFKRKRPPVWMRMIWDRTDLDQKIYNHQRGIGVQDRGYVCIILSFGMLVALILELITNAKYQGTPISTKPTFNYMIGPSAMVLINTGARFTPCIKFVANVSNIPFPCLNSTSSENSCTIPIEDLCGLGGFSKPNEPDQKFRFVLPLFLHAGVIHYILNIWVQLSSSALIERQMGSIRFLLLYIPSGIFGFILGGNFSLVGQPSVGASGAIFSTYAAILVDLVAHWSIEYRPTRKLIFLLVEIISGLVLGLIPGIDNFSHIGGFSMGLLLSIVLFPVLHRSKTHRFSFYLIRVLSLIGGIVMFVVLYHNFFKDDPAASCGWCRYLSCWPTASNNRCKGTGLTTTTTTTTTNPNGSVNNNSSKSGLVLVLPILNKLIISYIFKN